MGDHRRFEWEIIELTDFPASRLMTGGWAMILMTRNQMICLSLEIGNQGEFTLRFWGADLTRYLEDVPASPSRGSISRCKKNPFLASPVPPDIRDPSETLP